MNSNSFMNISKRSQLEFKMWLKKLGVKISDFLGFKQFNICVSGFVYETKCDVTFLKINLVVILYNINIIIL